MRFLSLALLLIVLPSVAAKAADLPWNQFRGPRGDGSSTSTNLPVVFGEDSPAIVWKVAVPGRAWSSPVVWGDRIWLTSASEIQNVTPEKPKLEKPIELRAVCVDLATGKILLDRVIFETDTPQFTHATNSYASPTPFVEEDRVYVHFGAYGTACLDAKTGDTVWERRDLPCDHFRGPGSSPVVYGDLLYLTFDGFDLQYFTALDKRTGATAWKKDRAVDFGTTDGDAKKAYSTPLLIEEGGRKLLVSPFAAATIAYQPETGEPIWTVRHGGMNAAGRPLFGNGLLYINSADGPNPLIAVRPSGVGDITSNIVWSASRAVPKRSSEILVNDLLFMVNDSGIASCLDAKSGEVIWTERFGGDYWSSPLIANGLIYCFSQNGDVPVFKASREFELVAKNHFENGFIASPAVAGDSLIVRTFTHLYRLETPQPTASGQ